MQAVCQLIHHTCNAIPRALPTRSQEDIDYQVCSYSTGSSWIFCTATLLYRAPEMARIAYASITAILSDPITRLIEMPSEVNRRCLLLMEVIGSTRNPNSANDSFLQSDWKWALAQYVNLDGWPIHWGGNMSENGDPKCPATIK